MASLVPFWHRQTGAQQRMFALVQAMKRNGHIVKTFFPIPGVANDQGLIEKYSLDVEQHTSDMPPEGVVDKTKWYIRAVANQVKTNLPSSNSEAAEQTTKLKLEDYHWPWARASFEKTVSRYQPDVIICQYVTTAWLLDGLSESLRSETHCIVDTHDLLSDRAEQFEQRGLDHWINISREEESAALAKFDTVLAIQRAEAVAMQAMALNTRVIVVGHHAGDCKIVERKQSERSAEQKFSLGYIASINASNIDAIESFLEQVWPRVAKDGPIELVIAGAICETVEERVEQLNQQNAGRVRLLGCVENLADFYREIDVAINPVQFGTGLKVKTVEALLHGIPVLTTEPQVAAGHEDAQSAAVVYCGSLTELGEEVARLLSDGSQQLERLKSAAREGANRSEKQDREAVYQELLDEIAEF